jgi:hypothetical protein
MSIFGYLLYQFYQESEDLIPMLKSVALKLGPTFANPL